MSSQASLEQLLPPALVGQRLGRHLHHVEARLLPPLEVEERRHRQPQLEGHRPRVVLRHVPHRLARPLLAVKRRGGVVDSRPPLHPHRPCRAGSGSSW